jgi:uncharacterized protein
MLMQLRIQQLIIQPSSGCNLNCSYCYVQNRRDHSQMNKATIEAIASKIVGSKLVSGEVDVIWHAGEPLLVGIDFYQRAIDLMRSHSRSGLSVRHFIQTNGTRLDEAWCRFFADHQFYVGLSLDGPDFIHDRSRRSWSGRGSHRATLRGYQLLRAHGISAGIICVLTRESLRYPIEICEFFVSIGTNYLCFNVEEIENANRHSSFSRAEAKAGRDQLIREYREFMAAFFDAWRPHASQMIVREFRDMVVAFQKIRSDPTHHVRPMETVELANLTVQRDGSVSSYSPELAGAEAPSFGNFVLGNINLDNLEEMIRLERLSALRREVVESVTNCRASCGYFPVCGGGFISNKFFENGTITSTETMTCRLHRQTLASMLLDKLSPVH